MLRKCFSYCGSSRGGVILPLEQSRLYCRPTRGVEQHVCAALPSLTVTPVALMSLVVPMFHVLPVLRLFPLWRGYVCGACVVRVSRVPCVSRGVLPDATSISRSGFCATWDGARSLLT